MAIHSIVNKECMDTSSVVESIFGAQALITTALLLFEGNTRLKNFEKIAKVKKLYIPIDLFFLTDMHMQSHICGLPVFVKHT